MGKYLILSIFLLYSCGKGELLDVINKKGIPKKKKSDIAFIKYIEKFNENLFVNSNVPIVFEDIDQGHAGVCKKWTNGYKEIGINRKYWDSISEEQREQLVFHELGHCVLNKGHNDGIIIFSGVTCPISIMRSQAFNSYEIDKCYNYDYNHYINELL